MVQTNLFNVADKTVCVTGASSGLGRSVATMLAQSGAKVVGVARRQAELEAWQRDAAGQTSIVTADLSDREALTETAQAISAPFGPIDILINAAGINTRQAADEVTVDQWDLTLNLNLSAPFFLAQALVPDMKQKGWGPHYQFCVATIASGL